MTTTEIIDNIVSTPGTNDNVRLIIPVLIRWAKSGLTDRTYTDLVNEIGKPSLLRGIGNPLGRCHDVMTKLSELTGESIPTLNVLCNSATHKLPSGHFSYVFPNYNTLSRKEKKVFVASLYEEAKQYEKWNWVLKSLGLEEAKTFTDAEIINIKGAGHSYGFGGEGPMHKALKEFILNNPESINIRKVTSKEIEHPLPSGDRLDVYFETEDNRHIAIEVKSSISSDEDITRGIFQCVKYKAILKALRQVESANYEFDAILVIEGQLSSENLKLAKELGVACIDKFKR